MKKTLYGHQQPVSAVRFLPGDECVVSASRDNSVMVFDVAAGYVLGCSACGALVLIGACRRIIRTLSVHTAWVRAVVPSHDGGLLATCSHDSVRVLWLAS